MSEQMTDERLDDLRHRSTDHFFDGVWTARSAREFIVEIDRLRKENVDLRNNPAHIINILDAEIDRLRTENHQLRTAQSIIEHERDALIAENVELTETSAGRASVECSTGWQRGDGDGIRMARESALHDIERRALKVVLSLCSIHSVHATPQDKEIVAIKDVYATLHAGSGA